MTLATRTLLTAAVALALGTGGAASTWALSSDDNPTHEGNTAPIDDNHANSPSPSPSSTATATAAAAARGHEGRHATPRATAEHATPEPGDDHGVDATPEATHRGHATPEQSEHATPEPGDDHGVDATPEASHTESPGDDGGHHGGGSGGGGGGDGGDDGGGHH